MPEPLTLMIVHAHPDDEVIGSGGVLAKYAAAGQRTVLVTCTLGEEGEIVVPEMDTPENHARLNEIRHAELLAAVAHLQVGTLEISAVPRLRHGRHARQRAPRQLQPRRS